MSWEEIMLPLERAAKEMVFRGGQVSMNSGTREMM
jgi:hypothetical protein